MMGQIQTLTMTPETVFSPAKRESGKRTDRYKNGREGKSNYFSPSQPVFPAVPIAGLFKSFPSFLAAVRMVPFHCPRIPTRRPCIFFHRFRLEFTFACISSSLFEPADSDDCAHVWERIPPGRPRAGILPQEHTFPLFAQLYLLLLMVEKGGSKDTWFRKTFHGLEEMKPKARGFPLLFLEAKSLSFLNSLLSMRKLL